MAKSYGKLTSDQFAEIVEFWPNLLAMVKDACEHLKNVPASRFDGVMTGDYGDYCQVYELTFLEHLSLVVVALGRQDYLRKMATAPDPQEAVLDGLRNLDQWDDDHPLHEAFEETSVIAMVYALGRTIQSVATYGRTISSLLHEVRENNNYDALFKAIRMDRAVIGCPTVMKILARAQIRDDKSFFKKLRSALGGPGNKQQAGLDGLRYAMLILLEMGLDHIPEAELEDLIVNKLKVYPKNQPNARKNIRAHYQQSRKIKTI